MAWVHSKGICFLLDEDDERDIKTYFDIMKNKWWHEVEVEADNDDEYLYTIWYMIPGHEDGGCVNMEYSVDLDDIDLAVIHRLYKEFGYDVTDEQIHNACDILNKLGELR